MDESDSLFSDSVMSTEPLDSCTQATISSDTELPLTERSGNLGSSEKVSIKSDTGDVCRDASDEWKKVSYFNPMTGTSIIKITSEMFNKSRGSCVQSKHLGAIDSNQRCNCEFNSHDLRPVECFNRSGHEALHSSGMNSGGVGKTSPKWGCFGEVASSEIAHSGHSVDFLGDEKVELDNDTFSSDFLFIDEPDYDYEEKVIYMDDKEEQAAWGSIAGHQVKEPSGDLRDDGSSDGLKDLSFSAARRPQMESSLQIAKEKCRGDQIENYAEKENKTEADFNDLAAVDVTDFTESSRREYDHRRSLVADYSKTADIVKSLNIETGDGKSKISPGPLRLTRLPKSTTTTAQPDFSYSVKPPSLFSAYPSSDVNINNTVCQTSVSSVSSILSLENRQSNRDETKGWAKDRGSFAPELPESSCRTDDSDNWAELEDLPTQSFEMRTFCPEKMDVDDLPLSKSDRQSESSHLSEACGGITSQLVPSSHVEQYHAEPYNAEVGLGQSEKLKLMQTRRKKKLSRRNEGVIDSGEISGNKGDRSIDELLEFINSTEAEQGKGKKTSQKVKKQLAALPSRSSLTDEIPYNWRTPDTSSTVPNGFLTHGRSVDYADLKEDADNSVEVIEKSTNDSCSVTVPGTALNLCTAPEEGRECVETVNDTVETSPSYSDAVSTFANGFKESKELGATARVEKKKKKAKSLLQASSPALQTSSYEAAEQAVTDTVTATSSSSLKSMSDSSSEAVATDDNDGNKDFTVVLKKKRNKVVHAETVQGYGTKTDQPSFDYGRTKVQQGGRKADDSWKAYPSKYNQPNRKSTSTVDNRNHVSSVFGALLYKDRSSSKGEVLGKSNNSGDSSETSSVCSASVHKESNSFTKTALGNTAVDTIPQRMRRNSETSVIFHKDKVTTLPSAKDNSELQRNENTAIGGDIKTIVSAHTADQCSSQDTFVIPESTDNSGKDRGSVEGTQLDSYSNKVLLPAGKELLPAGKVLLPEGKVFLPEGKVVLPEGKVFLPEGKVVLPEGKVVLPEGKVFLPEGKVFLPTGKVASSCHGSTSHQETTLPSATVIESSRASSRPSVVFDTREKSRFLAPASDIEFSFGFDAEDEGTPTVREEYTDSKVIPRPREAKSNPVHCFQTTPEPTNCNVAVDINCNHPHFQGGSVSKSAVIALPNHGFQPSASHVPLIYSSPHPLPLGVGYVVPVPIGIVPPFMTCNSRPLPSATVIPPHPAYGSKDIMAPLPDASFESTSQKQERYGAEICAPLAQLMVSPVPRELPIARCPPESSKSEGRSSYFDLAAAQAFLFSEFEAAVAPGSSIVYLTVDN